MVCTRMNRSPNLDSRCNMRGAPPDRPTVGGQKVRRLSRNGLQRLACSCSSNREPQVVPDDTAAGAPAIEGDQTVDLTTYSRRRWSNLNGNLEHAPGSFIGAATLIAGTTIGEFPSTCVDDQFRANFRHQKHTRNAQRSSSVAVALERGVSLRRGWNTGVACHNEGMPVNIETPLVPNQAMRVMNNAHSPNHTSHA